jgi:hypothetical protein
MYVISKDGKYCYKVSKDGKKTRISKEEYLKKTATKDAKNKPMKDTKKKVVKDAKKKPTKDIKKKATKHGKKKVMKGGAMEEQLIDWAIIIGKIGNLSLTLKTKLEKLEKFGFSEHLLEDIGLNNNYVIKDKKFVVIPFDEASLKDMPFSKVEELLIIICKENQIDPESGFYRKGAIIFASGEDDSTIFEKYKQESNNQQGQNNQGAKNAKESLWNINFAYPIQLFKQIKDFPNISFVYISSISVFTGLSETTTSRPEVILDNSLDFIDASKNYTNIEEIFKNEGPNTYAYGKRFVELELNKLSQLQTDSSSDSSSSESDESSGSQTGGSADSLAKVIILRTDAITDENTKNLHSSTFLKALKFYNPSTNLAALDQEIRYPVTASQVANVVIGAINFSQEENIKVYHVVGTEKEKGLTKADVIAAVLKINKPKKVDRKLDDTNTLAVAPDYYKGDKQFLEILTGIFDRIKDTAQNPVQNPQITTPPEPLSTETPPAQIVGGKNSKSQTKSSSKDLKKSSSKDLKKSSSKDLKKISLKY